MSPQNTSEPNSYIRIFPATSPFYPTFKGTKRTWGIFLRRGLYPSLCARVRIPMGGGWGFLPNPPNMRCTAYSRICRVHEYAQYTAVRRQ
jgi:hypothetical protein